MIELLSPAGSPEALKAAVTNGANAVYLGTTLLNARASAQNFDREALREAADYAHERNVKLHVTVNTMVKQSEESQLEEVAEMLSYAGVDAAIVQDIGVAAALKRMLPSLSLHASTQMAIHNAQGVRFCKEHGFDRVVLARELTFDEMRVCAREGIELESFAHGALCVACSGQCLMSSMIGGRSGNRGQCAQPCRLPYKLEGAVKSSGYLLSPKDLMTIDRLRQLRDAGIVSLKIEGRLKRPEYVAVVTRAYREALDCLETFGSYAPTEAVTEDLMQIFNRGGFTKGYGSGVDDKELMSVKKPNHFGVSVGTLIAKGEVRLDRDVEKGDALAFRDNKGQEFPVAAVEGSSGTIVKVKTPDGARPSAVLWRLTSTQQLRDAMEYTGADKQILTGFFGASVDNEAVLSFSDGTNVVTAKGDKVQRATGKPADLERIKAKLLQTGESPYDIIDLQMNVDSDAFVPMSMLGSLRRDALEQLKDIRIAANRGCSAKCKSLPEVPMTDAEPEKTVLSVQSQDAELLKKTSDWGADELIFSPARIEKEYLEACAEKIGGEFSVALPRTMNTASLMILYRWIVNENRVKSVLVSNPAHLILDWKDKTVRLDWGLNIANRRALEVYEGWKSYTPSLELNCADIRNLGMSDRRELVVYGRIPLMLLRHCPIAAVNGGKHAECRRCDIVPEGERITEHVLTDRTGASFPIERLRTEDGCILSLLNSVPLMTLRKKLPAASAWRILLTNEDDGMAEAVVRTHRAALDGRDFRNSGYWDMLDAAPSTTGHYFRGV